MQTNLKCLLIVSAMLAQPNFVLAKDIENTKLNSATTNAILPIVKTANRYFGRLPQVVLTDRITKLCSGDAQTNVNVRYCSDENTIFVAADLAQRIGVDQAAYSLSHVYGHAIQVRHGIATIAFRKIQSEPAREIELRGMVTRQVECVAGVLFGRAKPNIRKGLKNWFNAEPFTGSHWGATPMRSGPRVSISLATRHEWFERGRTAKDFKNCAYGEMGAELLLKAER